MSTAAGRAPFTHHLRPAESDDAASVVTLHPATTPGDLPGAAPGATRTATVDAHSWQVALQSLAAPTLQNGVAAGRLALVVDGKMVVAHIARAGARVWLHMDGAVWVLEEVSPTPAGGRPRPAAAGAPAHSNRLAAPMPGRVLDLLCAPGDAVQAGQTLVLLEAMKMELRLAAPAAGVVAALHVAAGAIVERGALLIELAPAATD